jgi:hypothetical protein
VFLVVSLISDLSADALHPRLESPPAFRESVTSWQYDLAVASDPQLKLPSQLEVSLAIGWPMLNVWN